MHAIHTSRGKTVISESNWTTHSRKDQTPKPALDRKQGLPKPKAKEAAEVGGHARWKAQVIICKKNRYEVK